MTTVRTIAIKQKNVTVKRVISGISGKSKLASLTDVDLTGLSNGKIISWDSDANVFVASTVGGSTDAGFLNGQEGSYYLDYNNFTNTPSIIDSAAVSTLIDSAIDILDTHDSAAVQGQIDASLSGFVSYDSAAVDAQIDSAIALLDTHDSAAVQGQINAALAGFTSYDSAAVDAQIDSAVTQSFIDTFDTHDSALVQGQIDTTLAGDVTIGGNLTVDGYIAGPSSMTIDPATVGTDSGTLIILGNLQVEGETTTVNSSTVTISDKNIVLADSATTASQANDAGITINGANATIQYKSTGDKWEFNKPIFHGADRVLTTADDLHDSALVQGQIDATVNALDTHDSAAVVNQINAEVDKDFVDALTIDYNTLSNKPSIPAFGTDYVDSAEVNTLITNADTHDSAATLAQINSVVNALDTHDSAAVAGQIAATSIGDLFDVDLSGISNNQVLKWDSANSRFIPANDATTGGGGTDADTLDGQDGSFYLNYNNFTNTPTIPALGTDYVDSAITSLLIDSALNAFDAHDSAAVQGQIDASLSGFTSYDSAAVDAQIDSAVTESFVRGFIDQTFIDTFDTHDSAAVLAQINAAVIDADTVDGLQANQFLRSDADDTTTGNLTVEGNLTTSNLITFEGDSATVTSASTAIVATAAMTSVQAIEATVVSVNASSGERQVSRVLLTHDTTDTYMNEYAVINTGASDEFTLDADTSGGDFRLKLDNISGNTLFAKSSITYL